MATRDTDLLIFRGYDDLAARVLPGADDGLPKGKLALHTAVAADGTTVLLIETPKAPLIGKAPAAPAGVARLEARIDPETSLVAARKDPKTALFKIVSTDSVESLVKALKPSPRTEPLAEIPQGHVLAWCRDGGAFAQLVRECLSLGCDRIRWASVGPKGSTAVVARIDTPPWYLIERWGRGDDPAAPPIFVVNSQDRFYVRWGFTHPLGGRVRVAENELLMADAGGSIVRLPSAEWRDLYDALSVSADGLDTAKWAGADPAPRFQVMLTMVEAPEIAEPELWLLSKDDLPSVERLLGLMPESDLKHLAIAFFDPKSIAAIEATGTTAPAAALREVITGRGRGWVNFGKKGFRALTGLPNLFLPIDRALDPQVRRDRVAAAFTLERGEIVVVEERPLTEGKRGMRALRIPEPSFKPLASYVDYVVTGDAARLASLINAEVFDPGPLATLMEAAGDGPSKRPPKNPTLNPVNRTNEPEKTPEPVKPLDPNSLKPIEILDTSDPRQADLAGARERAIESRIAMDPPGSPADWMTLAEMRLARDDRDAAVECLENARWTDASIDGIAVEKSIAALEAALDLKKKSANPADWPALARSTAEGEIRGLKLRALYTEAGRHPESTATPGYLESLYTETRAAIAGDRLRKKSRWLIWRAVLTKTGDDIEAERQREAILADLNQDGLAPIDRTDFVRPRLAEHSSGSEGDGELVRSLEALTRRLTRIEDARLRFTGTSLLARRWAELDDVARATQLANDAAAASDSPSPGLAARSAPVARILGNAAAALIRVANPKGPELFMKALDVVRGFSNGDERGRTMQALLEALASAQNPKLTTPLAEAALNALTPGAEGREDPRRAALTLKRCAPALVKLEVTAQARALAVRLAGEPMVAQEAHYLAGAVGALAQFARTKSLPDNVIKPILASVRKHKKDLEDVNVQLVDGAVALDGETFAIEISEQMRNQQPGDIKFAQITFWASAIQGLAQARAADVGLADLERALAIAWSLPNDDERRRCVKRLTGCAAAFGRVGAGLEIVREVVRRSEDKNIGPYFRSEVLSACVEGAARLGDRNGAFEVMDRVIKLVEATARSSAGDVTFLFDVLGLCVDHAVTIGAAGESAAIIKRVESLVEEWMDESSARYWTPFYRYRALAKCGRGLARLGQEGPGLEILSRILDASNPKPGQPGTKITGLDLIDLLREVVRSLSEIGGEQRLALVDRVLDAFLPEKSSILGEAGAELLGMILDEVVSPASRVRAEYARFLGAEERVIRERVANESVTGAPSPTAPSGPFPAAARRV